MLRRRTPGRRPAFDRLERREVPTVHFNIHYPASDPIFDIPTHRALLQQAADSLGNLLADSFGPIAPAGGNTWTARYQDPVTGGTATLNNPSIAANTIELFVGSRPLGGTEAGLGGAGGFSASGSQGWLDTVRGRGQAGALASPPSDVAPWGGSIAFGSQSNWYFGSTLAGIQSNQTDFYSVALHELGHVLGIGQTPAPGQTSWSRLVAGGQFTGATARAVNGGANVPLDAEGAHWAQGVLSGGQQPAMAPDLLNGTRKLFTPLDFAGLSDVGWVVVPTSAVQFGAALYVAGEGDGRATITVTRTDATQSAAVNYATQGGTATPGLDYMPVAGTLRFAPGEASKTFAVPIVQDTLTESDESIGLVLSQASGAVLGSTSRATLSIRDDDRHTAARFGDFDGDRKADFAVYRPTTSQWIIARSAGGSQVIQFGQPGVDRPIAGDFDGDGKQDLAVFRTTEATWLILYSGGGSQVIQFSLPGIDQPVPADYDGDGRTDLAVYRPTTAQWLILQTRAGGRVLQYGQPGVDQPEPADFDGDGKADLAVFRPTTAQWIILRSTAGGLIQQFGQTGVDRPVPADYDGDGKADLAVYRPTNSQWLVLRSSGGALVQQFGHAGIDRPVPADYDGDGKTDLAVFRPTTAQYLILRTTAGGQIVQFGAANLDQPLTLTADDLGGSSGLRALAFVAGTTTVQPVGPMLPVDWLSDVGLTSKRHS